MVHFHLSKTFTKETLRHGVNRKIRKSKIRYYKDRQDEQDKTSNLFSVSKLEALILNILFILVHSLLSHYFEITSEVIFPPNANEFDSAIVASDARFPAWQ